MEVIDAKLSMVFLDSTHRRTAEGLAAQIWSALPTSHRRFQQWVHSLGVMEKLLLTLAPTSQGRWRVGLKECFCGRDTCAGQKRRSVKTKRGKGTEDRGHCRPPWSSPLALRTERASPAEVKLVAQTLEERFVADVPERLIGDKAVTTATGWMNVCCKTSKRS